MKPVTLSNTAYFCDLGWTNAYCAVTFSVEVRWIGWIFSWFSFLQQEHEPELQSPEKATCEVDKDTNKSRGKSWLRSMIPLLSSYTFLWYFLRKSSYWWNRSLFAGGVVTGVNKNLTTCVQFPVFLAAEGATWRYSRLNIQCLLLL